MRTLYSSRIRRNRMISVRTLRNGLIVLRDENGNELIRFSKKQYKMFDKNIQGVFYNGNTIKQYVDS
jgi:hypothetical protein